MAAYKFVRTGWTRSPWGNFLGAVVFGLTSLIHVMGLSMFTCFARHDWLEMVGLRFNWFYYVVQPVQDRGFQGDGKFVTSLSSSCRAMACYD